MHDARDTLVSLLERGQVAKERSRDVQLAAGKLAGYPFKDARQLEAFHEYLVLAEKGGAISLDWERYHEGTQLARIRLKDPERLAGFLGISYLPKKVEAVFSNLDLAGLPNWCIDALAALQTRWLAGKSGFGLSVDDAHLLPALMTATRALESLPPDQPLDYRQFGARFLGDSKLTRTLAAPLAAFYANREDLQDMGRDEILPLLNLVPLAQPVLLRGPIILSDGKRAVNADIHPYLGVASTYLSKFEVIRVPNYLLTIENQSSFNEYTATVADDGLILYTAGFPTRAFQDFYSRITAQMDIPIYHWGDTDVGGFRIIKQLQKLSPTRIVRTHQMALPGGERVNQSQMKDLDKLLPINSSADAAIKRVLSGECGFQEQEAIPAVAIVV